MDCYSDNTRRFKIYFRFHGEIDLNFIKTLRAMLSQLGLYGEIDDVLNRHHSGIWGIAVSTNAFDVVNGIQLYFYP